MMNRCLSLFIVKVKWSSPHNILNLLSVPQANQPITTFKAIFFFLIYVWMPKNTRTTFFLNFNSSAIFNIQNLHHIAFILLSFNNIGVFSFSHLVIIQFKNWLPYPWSNNKWREPVPVSVCYKIDARRRSLSGQPKWPPMKGKDSSCVITHVYVCYFFTEQCDCHVNEF